MVSYRNPGIVKPEAWSFGFSFDAFLVLLSFPSVVGLYSPVLLILACLSALLSFVANHSGATITVVEIVTEANHA